MVYALLPESRPVRKDETLLKSFRLRLFGLADGVLKSL